MVKNFVKVVKFFVPEICALLINFFTKSKVNTLLFKINDLGRILQ